MRAEEEGVGFHGIKGHDGQPDVILVDTTWDTADFLQSAAEPHFTSLLQSAQTVCKNLEWTGLASFDFVLDEEGCFRFVDFNPRHWGSGDATLRSGVDLYGGLVRWIKDGAAGPPSRSTPGISHRVFPKYSFQPSGMSTWRRVTGLRDAPWDDPAFVAGEVTLEFLRSARRAATVRKPKKAR